ncbi:MAG: tetratricopeptide repeat protein [Anaerolineae bacterium]|nr:tetratricopeptide repeat protein [Anaerolineae bacterium]
MYVRRNYSQSFFHRRKKPPYVRRAVFLLLIAGLVYFGYQVATQPAAFAATTYTLLFAQTTPTPLPGTLVMQAQDYYLAGDLDQAAAYYELALAQRPENPEYLYDYGQIQIDRNQPAAALTAGATINRLFPEDVRGMALRARALAWQGDYSAAIPVALAGLQIDSNFAPLYEALSRAYIGASQWAQGVEAGLRAVDLAPDDVRARWAYAGALMAVGARERAVLELENTLTLQPMFIPPYFELAFMYLSADRDQEAIDLYNRVLGMQPRNARAMLRLCEAYRKIGEFERAIGMCQDAVTTDPAFTAAQYRLGILRYNRREFAAARTAFQACVDQDPGSLECTFRLGLAHYYVASTGYQTCVNAGSRACDVRPDCEVAARLLEESLGRAQLQGGLEDTIAIIREGLQALSADPACPGFSARRPESTPEPTAEAAQ